MYKSLLKPILFFLSAEKAHHFTLSIFKIFLLIPGLSFLLKQYFTVRDTSLRRSFLGLEFPNPVGLAAGFDKDGKHIKAMSTLGFGFIELGTVTPRPQIGNPKPRLFRLPKDEALINRMGFNNEGVSALVERLEDYRRDGVIIGGNIGKNKDTPNEEAVRDYLYCFDQLYPFVDYFVVNVSSPNTPNLRALQDKEPLTKLLSELQALNQQQPIPKPILLKIAPDLTEGQLDDIIEIVSTTNIEGVIATNTTIDRSGLQTNTQTVENIGAGGLSGQPVKARSTAIIQYLHKTSKGKLFIIGVGGIAGPEDAIEKLEAGASLVQLYSGMIYEGPGLVRRINKRLLKKD